MIEKIDELAPNVVFLEKVSWVGEKPRDGFVCSARVRYRQEKQDCVIGFEGEKIKVVFDKHQKGVAEGQSVVLMDGNRCIGGGIIFS
jgi:tRNA-specific 2-thiouridylase